MTRPSPAARRGFTLADAATEFWKYPSPRIIGTAFVVALAARILLGGWHWTEVLIPFGLLAVFPFLEWIVHVFVLHWRPRSLGRITVDSLLARKHREHHVDPRAVALIFIPWPALPWIVALVVALACAFPTAALGLTFIVTVTLFGLGYEWCHYLIHSDYKPKSALYRAVWMNHRQHHYKNEHYWFTVTSAGTADRILGTYPDAQSVAASPTAKNLHAVTPGR